jgi:uncharacterized repeat protein (TIGR03803 family)
MSKVMMRTAFAVTAVMAAVCAQSAQAAAPAPIYTFQAGNDGSFPRGGVIQDPKGNLYGTTTSGGAGHNGVVYELKKGKGGSWTQSTLYAFTGGDDGSNSQAGLLRDAKGNLYGTTYAGGADGYGVVFELSPPKKGSQTWKHKTLWTFTGGNDGGEPTGTLIMDSAGNLIGTSGEGGTGVVGTVFELSPPAAGQKDWTQTVLYNFTGNADGGEPYGRMLLASDGNLYGTTAGYGQFNYGNVFKLAANGGGGWDFSVLHSFAGGSDGEVPRDGLIQGPDGTLYGDTAGFDNSYGNVFSLNTDGSAYSVLWEVAGGQGFEGNGPWQSLSMDAAGALYGATYGDGESASGEIFKLTPPKKDSKPWKAEVLLAYQGNSAGEFPYTNVLVGTDGKLYWTSYGTAGQSGFFPGLVWSLKAK